MGSMNSNVRNFKYKTAQRGGFLMLRFERDHLPRSHRNFVHHKFKTI